MICEFKKKTKTQKNIRMSIYLASPSSQQAHTHFAVFVQVWIQSISAVRDIEEYWWRVWIV